MLTNDHNLPYNYVLVTLLRDCCDIGGVLGHYEVRIHFLAINRKHLNPAGCTVPPPTVVRVVDIKNLVVLVTFDTLPVGRSGPYFILLFTYLGEQKYKI